MTLRVLVVDDDERLYALIASYLEQNDVSPVSALNGRRALELLEREGFDAVLLDVMMPGIDGIEVCKRLRQKSNVPIVMLTAKGDETDRVVGLELGADDYVVKPFSPKELVARIRAVLRRTRAAERGAEVLRAADIEIDTGKMRVTVAGRPVELTPTEFQLVSTLVAEPGRVFTRGQLLDAVHGIAIESYERAIDAHVKNIRRKIEPDPRSPRYLQTVFGVGYRFAEPD